MHYKNFNRLSIDGTLLTGQEIVKYCLSQPQSNLHRIGEFMKDWLSEDAGLTVRTSGSTGKPKEIRLEKKQMLASAAATAAYFNFRKDKNALLSLNVDYIAGKMMIVRALYSQLNLVCIEPCIDPISQLNSDAEIQFAPLTPMQMDNCSDTRGIRTILLGGGSVSATLEEKLQHVEAELFHGYGMTETISHIALRRVNGPGKSAFFTAMPGVSFELDDRNCLVIHVPYLDCPVVTNDLAELSDTYTMEWRGRVDDIINSGGIKINPSEIETRLLLWMKRRYFVAGLPDEKLGQKLCLFIEGEPFNESELQHLKEIINHSEHKYHKPREIYFIRQFAETETGKIHRVNTVKMLSGQ